MSASEQLADLSEVLEEQRQTTLQTLKRVRGNPDEMLAEMLQSVYDQSNATLVVLQQLCALLGAFFDAVETEPEED